MTCYAASDNRYSARGGRRPLRVCIHECIHVLYACIEYAFVEVQWLRE